VIIVEMDESHAFHQPCRLVPFDGSSVGRQVGPQGTCTSAAWSPDGTWMYFGARVGGTAHLWRQRFPNGAPEQITFGPTEEEGIALASDGRSLVTSVGTRRSAIWLHDAAGERAISSEGYALAPRLSRDGSRVFYLFARDLTLSARGWESSSAELRVMDVASGKSTTLLPGASVADYDISHDEKEVVFATTSSVGKDSTIWVASLARETAPRAIARWGDQVSFGADGELVFRSLLEDNALVRIKRDGTGRERITSMPVINKFGMSPDGEWAIAFRPGVGENLATTFAVPTHGGPPRILCAGPCKAVWSADGRFLYVWANGQVNGQDKTFVIPVPAGTSMPDLPPAGLKWDPVPPAMPGTILIDQKVSWPGPDPSTYVFTKSDLQRNLFRIPLH
jgi:dipeptidyl aminopeptidase/acylaminoacyl peptidase